MDLYHLGSIIVYCMHSCWMLLSNQIFELKNRMGEGGSGCGIRLLGVTSNKLVAFPRRNSIRPLGVCAAPSGECN